MRTWNMGEKKGYFEILWASRIAGCELINSSHGADLGLSTELMFGPGIHVNFGVTMGDGCKQRLMVEMSSFWSPLHTFCLVNISLGNLYGFWPM